MERLQATYPEWLAELDTEMHTACTCSILPVQSELQSVSNNNSINGDVVNLPPLTDTFKSEAIVS
jgi:hypothetical protein